MISVLLESALRSLVLALAVWAGLRAFRVSNVLAQKAAWGLVLVSALAMPLLLPLTARFQVIPVNAGLVLPAEAQTLLQELQARIQSHPSRPFKPAPVITAAPESSAARATSPDTATPTPETASAPRAASAQHTSHERNTFAPPVSSQAAVPDVFTPVTSAPAPTQPQSNAHSISPALLAFGFYLAVVAVLLLRLVCGLIVTFRLWHTATSVSSDLLAPIDPTLPVRSSGRVASPLTIGSGVVLPETFMSWDNEKLRIVLAHERSHIRQRDFYIQILAGLYASLVWFSPLGWWIKRKLSDLAEAISDRAGLEHAASPTSYAQILLEFAAAPRPTPIGVAMARTGSLSRRIERLLNDSAFRQAFTGSRRALAAVLLVPLALVLSTAGFRVQAAQQAPQAAAAPATAPEPAAAPTPATAAEPAATSDSTPAPAAAPDAAPSTEVTVPAQVVKIPAVHVPAQVVTIPEVNVHAQSVTIPEVNVPAQTVTIPRIDVKIPPRPRMVATQSPRS